MWGYSVFREALEKFCDDGGFIFHLFLVLLVLLIFVCSVVIVPISIYIKARKSEPASSTRL